TWYKPSKLPHAFIHRPMASRAVFSLVASPVSTLAADPNSTCTSSLFSGLRPTATTLAPWLMKNLDAERPSPAVPPMMTMCLFVNIQISYDVIRQMYSVWPTHFGTFRSVDTRILTSAGRVRLLACCTLYHPGLIYSDLNHLWLLRGRSAGFGFVAMGYSVYPVAFWMYLPVRRCSIANKKLACVDDKVCHRRRPEGIPNYFYGFGYILGLISSSRSGIG